MDVDAFVDAHTAEWERLDRLSRRARLRAAEADELVSLYQRVSVHLSRVRSAAPDPTLVARLSGLVNRARQRITGTQEDPGRDLVRFVVHQLPAGLYRLRWLTLVVAAAFVLVGGAAGIWVAGDPAVQAAIGSDEEIRQLCEVDFEAYYSTAPAASFAAQVWTNNAWLSAMAVAGGITGVLPAYSFVLNAVNVGVTGGLMASCGRLDLFFGLITPHGLLELTCLFVAMAAGFRLFWAWVDPGPRTRLNALAQEGRALVGVAIGLAVALLVSGVVEAFVTPSPLPTWARVGIGALVWAVFLAYMLLIGRRAALAGETGDVRAEYAGDTVPVAA